MTRKRTWCLHRTRMFMCMFMCVYVRVCVRVCVCVYVFMHVCVLQCAYMCVCVHTCMRVGVCVYIYIYIYMYIHIHIYIYVYRERGVVMRVCVCLCVCIVCDIEDSILKMWQCVNMMCVSATTQLYVFNPRTIATEAVNGRGSLRRGGEAEFELVRGGVGNNYLSMVVHH